MDNSLSVALLMLACLLIPGAGVALLYRLIVCRPDVNAITMDYQIAFISADYKIVFQRVYSQVILVLGTLAPVLFILFTGSKAVGAVIAITIWFLSAIYLVSRLFKTPSLCITPQEKVIEIGRKAASK